MFLSQNIEWTDEDEARMGAYFDELGRRARRNARRRERYAAKKAAAMVAAIESSAALSLSRRWAREDGEDKPS